MIIKSMARKQPSFDQLVDYLGYFHKRKSAFGLTHNLYASGEDRAAMVQEFEENYRYLPPRKNGNALYHEVIALDPNTKMHKRKQIKALRDLARQYLAKRAPEQLAYGVIHTDTPYLHMHLVISSNSVKSQKRARLAKKEFAAVQREVEAYKIEHYPELGDEKYYAKKTTRARRTNREQQAEQRTQKPSHKQVMAEKLAKVLRAAKDRATLAAGLAEHDLTLYTRGKSVGVQTKGGRRYRFATLGLGRLYAERASEFDLIATRTAMLSRYSDGREAEYEF